MPRLTLTLLVSLALAAGSAFAQTTTWNTAFTGTTTITGGKIYPSQDNVFGDSTQVGGSQANNKVLLNGGSLFTPDLTIRNFVTAVEVGANGGYVDTYSASQKARCGSTRRSAAPASSPCLAGAW